MTENAILDRLENLEANVLANYNLAVANALNLFKKNVKEKLSEGGDLGDLKNEDIKTMIHYGEILITKHDDEIKYWYKELKDNKNVDIDQWKLDNPGWEYTERTEIPA